MRKNILSFLMIFILLSCNKKTENKLDIESSNKKPKTEIDASIALQFLNDYTELSNKIILKKSDINIEEWIKKSTSVTEDFKNSYETLIKDAEKEDPELSLDFDPIFDAQDYPEKGFEVSKIDNEDNYITFKSKDSNEFLLNIKVKLTNKKWLVDGAGIINIPQNKRIKR
ncbi:MAG: hypothetical protein V4497_12385 [Bacteroidota bacterium]